MAKTYGIDPADAGIMLAAARAVTSLANTRSDEAKRAKREEDETTAFFARAMKEARAKMATDWPMTTVHDKVTLVALDRALTFLDQSISRTCDPLQTLNRYVDDSLTCIAREAANRSRYKKLTITEALCQLAREFEQHKFKRQTAELADKISALLAPNALANQAAA